MSARLRVFLSFVLVVLHASTPAWAVDLQRTIREAQSKVVKIYGAGGFKQMEAYQTGILISAEGHVLTAQSYVLDTDDLVVTLHDGRKWNAKYLASDPITDLALLKLPVEAEQLPHFEWRSKSSRRAQPGQRILALSNLYGIATGDEPVSVLQGVVTAIAPLKARRGAFQSNYRDEVYVLDAYSNNPGAAGGALVDWQGNLLGVLGKELRSQVTGTWLNYALPVDGIATTIERMLEGRIDTAASPLPDDVETHSTESLGISLIPDVLPRTPPYVDSVRRGSPAEKAGLRADDLIVFVNGEPIDSHRSLLTQLSRIENLDPVTVSVLREGKLRDFPLESLSDSAESEPASVEDSDLEPIVE